MQVALPTHIPDDIFVWNAKQEVMVVLQKTSSTDSDLGIAVPSRIGLMQYLPPEFCVVIYKERCNI